MSPRIHHTELTQLWTLQSLQPASPNKFLVCLKPVSVGFLSLDTERAPTTTFEERFLSPDMSFQTKGRGMRSVSRASCLYLNQELQAAASGSPETAWELPSTWNPDTVLDTRHLWALRARREKAASES